MADEKLNPRTQVGTPISTAEVKGQSATARGADRPNTTDDEAVTPENMGGPQGRLTAEIKAILRNKALAEATAEAEAKFDAEYDEDDDNLPATMEEALAVTRVVESEGDLRDLDGFRAATTSAQDQFEQVLIRPNTLVVGTVDVYDAGDLSKRVTLYDGDKVEGSSKGYIPTNYISEERRIRILGGK